MKQQKSKTLTGRKLFTGVSCAVIVVLLMVAGCYAWFYYHNVLATVARISAPDELTISGPHDSDMFQLNLEYTATDVDAEGNVKIQRVVCIKSKAVSHQLEIAHTTNIKGLSFEVYRATETTTNSSDALSETVDGTVYYYTYTPPDKVNGTYQNQNQEYANGNIAASSGDYHAQTYARGNGTYDDVQINAEPLYWLSDAQTASDVTDSGYSLNYYVINITWKEPTKETDLVYLMARNGSSS